MIASETRPPQANVHVTLAAASIPRLTVPRPDIRRRVTIIMTWVSRYLHPVSQLAANCAICAVVGWCIQGTREYVYKTGYDFKLGTLIQSKVDCCKRILAAVVALGIVHIRMR